MGIKAAIETRWGRLDPVLVVFVVFALVVRLPPLASDFWLDEIWTLEIARKLGSPFELFTQVRHSNNHHLNTLIFHLIGESAHWGWYRVHSLLAGVGCVALTGSILAPLGRIEARIGSLLMAGSYIAIHFSSEARGYAMATFFALAAVRLLQRERMRPSRAGTVGFAVVSCLGFLSHLLFVHAFVALAMWLALDCWQRERRVPAVVGSGVRYFAAPAAFLLAFYALDVSRTKIGKGPDYALFDVLVKAGSYAAGGPAGGGLALVVACLFVAATLAAVWWQWRSGRSAWLLYAIVIFASPALVLTAMRPKVMFVRYFVLSVAFALLCLSGPLAALWRRGGGARRLAAAAIAASLLGNGVNVSALYRDGRGDYRGVLEYIRTHTRHPPPRVTSDNHFRNGMVIRFYEERMPEADRIEYVRGTAAPEWRLHHRIGPLDDPPQTLQLAGGVRYRLVEIARYSDLSGWHWLVYQRED